MINEGEDGKEGWTVGKGKWKGSRSSGGNSSSSEVILYAVSNELSDDREDERA